MIEQLNDFHNGDGICKYLDSTTNLCLIYESRPDICNVEKSYKAFSDIYSKDEYYRLNYEGCQMLWEIEKKKVKKDL